MVSWFSTSCQLSFTTAMNNLKNHTHISSQPRLLGVISLCLILCFLGTPMAVAGKSPAGSQELRVADKWAVVIGISQFFDPKVPTLKYSAKDATDFYNYLTDPAAGHFAPDHVKLLTNEDATKVNIMDALGDSFLPHAAAPDDLVVIYLSTHGSPAGADIRGVNYVVAYDTRVDKLFATGIEMRQLLRMIKERVHTNRIVLLLDTCFSGAGAAGGHKGLSRTNVDTQEVAQGIGSLVISSSAPDQRSWESDQLKNSYFTRYLIDALKKEGGKSPVDRVFGYMREKVQADVLRDKGEMQTPVIASAFTGPGVVLSVPSSAPRSAPYTVPQLLESHDSQSKMLPGTNLVSYTQHMQLANQLIDQHKLWDATHELEQASSLNPTSVEAYLVSADVYNAQKRYPEALEAAKRAVLNDSNSSRAHEALARAYLCAGEVGESLRQAQQSITLDPNNSMAHNLLGFIQEHNFNRTDQAEQAYSKALALNGVNTRALVNLGLLKQRAGHPEQSEQLFAKAVASDSGDWEAHWALGKLLKERSAYKESESELREAIQLDPSNFKLHSELGTILSASRQKDAESELRKGIELAAGVGEAHLQLALFLSGMPGRTDESENEFRKAIDLDPSLDKARVGLANLLIDHRQTYDEADRQFRKALETDPRNASAYVGIARVYADLYHNYTGAYQELKKALGLNPNDSLAHDRLGLVLSSHLKRYDEARKEFEAAISSNPACAVAHYHLGQYLVGECQSFDQAAAEFKKAIELDPSDARFYTTAGTLETTHYKRYKDAASLFNKALELNPADAEAHYRLGLISIEKFGQRHSGESELKKAYQIDPANDEYTKAFKRYCR